MEALRKEVVASVGLVELRASEDELVVLEAALSHFLDTFSKELSRKLGAKRDEVEGLRDDLREILGMEKAPEPVVEMAEKS